MRELTKKQKKLLDGWFDSLKSPKGSYNPFTHGQYSVDIEDLFDINPELYDRLKEINDTEILYQNVNRYLSDKSFEWVRNFR